MGVVIAIILIIIFAKPIFYIISYLFTFIFFIFMAIIGIPVFYFNELINPSYKLFPSIFVGSVNAMLCFSVYAFLYSSGVRMPYLIGLAGVLFLMPIIRALRHKPKEQEELKETKEEKQDTETIMLDYYKILGVSRAASLDEIINAYENKKEELINEYGTALNKKGELYLKVYSILSDETSRTKYDEECKLYLHQHSGIYNNLVPMMKKNENLYNKTNSSNTQLNNDILVDNEKTSNDMYKIAKALIITLVFMIILFFLTKDFIDL